MDWGFSWAVVITGLVVVFVVLVLLVLLCMALGGVFSTIAKHNKTAKTSDTESSPVQASPQGGAVIKMAQNSVADEVVVAITAAISAMMSENGVSKPFAVRSIKKSRNGRSAWNAAGIQENTRPF